MKISYNHLIKHISNKPDIIDLSEKLFHLGHEHEINEGIFDIEFTPNRGDCLSVNGILRDLKLFYDININQEVYKNNVDKLNFNFSNNAKKACPKISFLHLDIDSVPKCLNPEIDNYFSEMGVKKNNFFTDISNYLSYETGQPTHCYEAKKVKSGLKLELLSCKQKFETLHGKIIDLEEGSLVFLNEDNQIVNLAGLIGANDASCKKNTRSIILECAYFDPEAILGKSVKYDLNSEAAHKFERNVDFDSHNFVINRFIKIVEQHTKITNLRISSFSYTTPEQHRIQLNINKINQILGINITENSCRRYLEKFGFSIENGLIQVPSYRNDVIHINDIAEEIARAIGYDNIKPKQFKVSSQKNKSIKNANDYFIKKVLVENGFHEVINDPFSSEKSDKSIQIDNPLDSNKKFLRTNLKNSLLNNLLYNERRQHDSIKLFEITNLYTLSSDSPQKVIGIIVSGRVDKNYRDFSKKLDDKYLQKLLSPFTLNNPHYEIIDRNKFKSKSKNKIAYVEIKLDDLILSKEIPIYKNTLSLDKKYDPVSEYPSSTRDLSFCITDYSKTQTVQDYLLSYKHDLLKSVFIFDFYNNEKKAEIKIGFRFTFQSKNSTITEEEINNIMRNLIGFASSIEGVTIPGID